MKNTIDGSPTTLAALICITALLVGFVPVRADDQVAGGGTFTSKKGWFTVRVPRADTVTGRLFDVTDTWSRGESAYEEAVFQISGLGEVYRVGVRRTGAETRLLVPGAPSGELSPDALSYLVLALHYGGRVPGSFTVAETNVLTIPRGTGMLRVNRVQGGSVLQGLTLQTDPDVAAARAKSAYPGRRTADSVVVTGAVPVGPYVFYASAQNDYIGLDELGRERRVAVLKDRVQGMLESLVLVKELPSK